MILVIPSINLKKGICTSIISGQSGTESYYKDISENPVELCSLFRRENSKSLLIKDIDSFENEDNSLNMNAVLYICNTVDIPIQYDSDFKSVDECRMALESGIYRVIIRDLIFFDPEGVSELIKKYTLSRIAFGLEVENRKYYSKQLENYITDEKFIDTVIKLGGNRIYYNEKDWICKPDSADYELLSELANKYKIRITVVNGINTPQKLWEINNYKFKGIDSLVIGKPLYDNNFPCQIIWRFIEAEVEDVKK